VRHLEVHEDDIRLQLGRELGGVDAVLGLANHLHSRVLVEEAGESRPEEGLIVCDYDANCFGGDRHWNGAPCPIDPNLVWASAVLSGRWHAPWFRSEEGLIVCDYDANCFGGDRHWNGAPCPIDPNLVWASAVLSGRWHAPWCRRQCGFQCAARPRG